MYSRPTVLRDKDQALLALCRAILRLSIAQVRTPEPSLREQAVLLARELAAGGIELRPRRVRP